jgi:EmrB/QacA subfamily drug resistance transporter
MSSNAAATSGANFHLEPRQKLEILLAIMLALFLFALDQTVVGTALPVIVTKLNGAELYTWAVTLYLLTATISGPIYGKLSDLYGRRPIFIWALGVFILSSIGAGLSQEMWQFVLFRGLQGLGGGAVFPIALAVIADLYPPQERAKYGAAFGAVFGLSSVLGPGVGGLLTDNLGWPSIFFFNVPIALISLYVCWRLLPAIKNPEGGRNIDYIGAALLAAAIGPFLVGMSNKQTIASWTDPWVGGLIVLGVLIGVVFILWERRAKDPIVNLELFRNRNVTIAIAGMFFVAFGFFGAIIFLPRWFQAVKELTATASGYNLLPLIIALILSATLSGQIVARTGKFKILITGAMLLLAAGLFLMTNLRADTDVLVLWFWMVVAGLGVGPSFAIFTVVVQNSVAPRFVGVATASLTFFQQIGGTIGLTLAGTFLADNLARQIPERLTANGVPDQIIAGFQSGGGGSVLQLTGTGNLGEQILAATPEQFRAFVEPFIGAIVQSIHEALALSIANSLWVGIAAALVAAGFCLFLKEVPLTEMNADPAAVPTGDTAPA